MIAAEHPIVEKLAALPFTFELIGSRMFQFDPRQARYADWDFMVLRGGHENGIKLAAALKDLGFAYASNRRITSYESDGGCSVWRWEEPTPATAPGPRTPSVDVLILYDEKEYARRLRVLRMLRDMGAKGLYDALHGRSAGWCDLFGLISRLERPGPP